MDGNGRWARKQGFARMLGHEHGADLVENIVTFCAEKGVSWLTLYAFSIDNWKRPEREVRALMKLLRKFLKSKRQLFIDEQIRFRAVGRREKLPENARNDVEDLETLTHDFKGMGLNLALSYGGQQEIADAARDLCRRAREGELDPEDVDTGMLQDAMETGHVPHPDMLIRTGGDLRISNFLLWQISYTELFFTETLWPDFTVGELQNMIDEFHTRERRYGEIAHD
jgi:undecaprenyl diphosphate synthase